MRRYKLYPSDRKGMEHDYQGAEGYTKDTSVLYFGIEFDENKRLYDSR